MIAPPRIATSLLRKALPSDLRGQTIVGDLIQELEERGGLHGKLRLRAWYWAQVLELSARYLLFRAGEARTTRQRAAAARCGGVDARPLTREEAMENLRTDLRYGVRMLFRTPTLSSVSILTIGLGIGLVTFTFSAVYGSVLRPMPVRDPERLVVVEGLEPESGNWGMYWPMADYVEFRDQSTVFESLAAGYAGTVNVAADDGPPQRFDGAFMTANGLDILGVSPHLGRTFRPGEDRPEAEGTVVLGYDVWRNRFGADEDIIGRRVRANGESMTVIGVMPPGFRFPFDQEIWLAYRGEWQGLPRRDGNVFQLYGYLRAGVTIEAAREEAETIAARLAAEFPGTNEGITADVERYQEFHMPAEITAVLWLMLGATIGVMLIGCANVANLLLARAALRTRDVAVRTALGASRLRVVRQLLTEALILGGLGGLVGIVLAYVGTDLFNGAVANIEKPYWIDMRTDVPALAFSFAATLVAALAAGTIPALRASGAAVGGVLRDESRGASSLRIGRLSAVLVVGELAVSCALLIAAGFMVQSIRNTRTIELGFEPDGLLTARVGLFETEYPTRDDRQQFFRDLYDRLNEQPGVRSAALTTGLPSTGAPRPQFALEGEARETDADYPRVNAAQVSAGYFATMGAELIAGREFRPAESFWSSATAAQTEPVAIVNRSFVERYYPTGDALGKRLRLGTGDSAAPWMRIVGVVPDQFVGGGVGGIGNDQVPPEQIYYPLGQGDPRFVSMALRAERSSEELADRARQAVTAIDPNLPIYWVMPMSQVLADNSWAISLFGSLFTIFGAAALFLAAVGLYGVVSFSVAQRRQEMGVRMALGAKTSDILGIVFRRVGLQLAIGLSIGVGLAWAASGPLRFVMFGVETTDVSVYAVVVATLAATGMLATFLPASRATRVDPVTALRP
jgi:predicted permease